MVYLSKKDADKIVKELSKNPKEEIKNLIQKINIPQKRRVYVTEHLEIKKLLRTAFKEKRQVKIRYYSLSSDENTTRVIDVYKIHQDAIIAFCHLRQEERTFVIKRINSAAILDEKYKIPKGWNPESIILDK